MFKVNNKDKKMVNFNLANFGFLKRDPGTGVFFVNFCEISKNTFSYRTPPEAAFNPTNSN